jgi:hypothetical protein
MCYKYKYIYDNSFGNLQLTVDNVHKYSKNIHESMVARTNLLIFYFNN